MRVAIVFASLFLTTTTVAWAEDPFEGSPRGMLSVKLELSGTNRVDLPNGVEWAAIEARRSMAVEFALVDVGNDGLPIVAAKRDGPALSPEMDSLKGKIEACGEDQACLARTMMEFAAAGGGGANVFQQMTGQQPGRYRNFAGDRSGTCAKGTLVVKDVLTGVYIPPPEPARAYRFTRNGSRELPATDAALTDAVCGIEMTLDTVAKTISLRLPASLAVGVSLGTGAFTDERAVKLVEGDRFIAIHEQPAGGPGAWSGSAEIANAGSASHNSGQVVAPLKGRLEWRFSER